MVKKRIMVDMSATIIHHGHTRLLKKASNYGDVIVGLTSDNEVLKKKGYTPELSFEHRKEVLEAIKYVSEVVSVPWALNDKVLQKHNIDLLVHGDDNSNDIKKEKLLIFPRTKGISSSEMREKTFLICLDKQNNIHNKWNEYKKQIDKQENFCQFRQKDIWFLSIGKNIGDEQYGKGDEFLRPVLVYKKFSKRIFLGIPLSTTKNKGSYYFSFEYKKDTISTANFSQIKIFDIKRAKYRSGFIKNKDFKALSDKLNKLLKLPLEKQEERIIAKE
jgi:cytidyltransferase-like protein